MSGTTINLTGRWQGVYNYPLLEQPNEFAAELVDHNGNLTGVTEESGTLPDSDGQMFPALIEGIREGVSVTFRKFYDDLRLAGDTVFYEGRVDQEGLEITGNWDIPGELGGTFIMIRPHNVSVSLEKDVAEPVR